MCIEVQSRGVATRMLLDSPGLFLTRELDVRGRLPDFCCIRVLILFDQA